MRKTVLFLASLLTAAVFLAGPVVQGTACAAQKSVIQVSAAISLKNALADLKQIYAGKAPTVEIQFNLASSGMLQKQIEEGAPVDLFISAGKKQMDALAAKGLIAADTRSDLLGNELVLVVAKEKKNVIKTFADLAGKAQSISIGQPETVPAGKYGKETLTYLKLWDKVEKKIMFAKDVRQVLAYVESGNVDAGLVYRSDAREMKSGAVAAVAPKGSHSPILYPMAVVTATKNKAETSRFMEFLKSKAAAKVFASHGFVPLAEKQK
jgi:molybdate transport system substrate-binding protein